MAKSPAPNVTHKRHRSSGWWMVDPLWTNDWEVGGPANLLPLNHAMAWADGPGIRTQSAELGRGLGNPEKGQAKLSHHLGGVRALHPNSIIKNNYEL